MNKKDNGFIVFCKADETFWNGMGWSKQLRNAKIYHWQTKAYDIVERFPTLELSILPVSIEVQM